MVTGTDDKSRQSESGLNARVDRAEQPGACQCAGKCGDRVDLSLADVHENRPRAHAADRPTDAEQHATRDIAAMLRLEFDFDRVAEERAAVTLDEPYARCGNRDRGADDSVELKAREEEHGLDVVVVGCATAAQDEAEYRAQQHIEQCHYEPR